MFFRTKKSKGNEYLQIVQNRREGRKTKQSVIATLGRLDEMRKSGHMEALLRSGARFSEKLMILEARKKEDTSDGFPSKRIGPALIFERLWEKTGCKAAVLEFLGHRKFDFPVERAVFLTVLHRLFCPGSDRAAEKWRKNYVIAGTEKLELHHLYRAMFWLGKALDSEEQEGNTGFSPRCTKDLIEEALFDYRRDLFSELDIVFFDTTSLYFEGEGGQTIGQHGNSKDSRPDLKQMVVAAVLDGEGRPICCELWPGNTTDVTTLIPVVNRLQKRFSIRNICIVADRGMISKSTIEKIESNEFEWQYILGARMRKQTEVRDEVLSRAGRYQIVHPKSNDLKDPSPLKVKETWVEGRRYVVCLNEDQATKDTADREAIIKSLREHLKHGDKSLVGNKGFRKFLQTEGVHFAIDEDKIKEEARFDGKWVLRTNTDLPASEVALKYKQLWVVEDLFRSIKSLLETRPIYHKCDETIRGHVFCSFLALILRKEIQDRLELKDYSFEWADVVNDLNELGQMDVVQDGKHFILRFESKGCCGKVFQAAGVAMPPTIREVNATPPPSRTRRGTCVVPTIS
jgi:hypothetical protein